jgi:sugar phosphate permease
MLGMLCLVGLLLVLFGLSTYSNFVMLTFIAIALVGLFQAPFFALVNSSLLEVTPDTMRGRIMGVLSLDRSMIILGGSAAGFLAAAVGPQLAQIYFGAGMIVLGVIAAILMPSLRRF